MKAWPFQTDPARFAATNPPLYQEFEIDRACGVAIKTVRKCVFQPFECEMRPATGIGPIEKRTVLAAIRRL
jgi:hypothetical protein